ncbi:substrate-binding periplasmic protein [Chitinimonas sp. PSY-7]|uniref:transporter substrate-binding domain-containing protein n=1 Tax=Chitinimonas sp. PSY-7 TaxID=3459088 RepID=UPI004040024B
MMVRALLAFLLCLAVHAGGVHAYTEDLPPFNLLNEHGEPSGYAVEVLSLLMKEANQEYKLELVPWARALSLAKQQPDTLVFTIARTPEREVYFHWIGPYASRVTSLLRLSSSEARASTLTEARRFRVAVLNGDVGMDMLLAQGFVRGFNLITVDKRNDLIKLLQLKSVDFVAGNPAMMRYVASRTELPVDQLVTELTMSKRTDGYYFALNRQSDPEIVQRLQSAFERLQSNNVLEPLKRKYQID